MGTVHAKSAPTTGPELVARARALIPMLAENAVQAEKQRKPVDAVITALEDAEIYKLMVPRCYGGLELDMDTFFEVGTALGEGDASTAWVSNFYIEHNWILSQFPASFQQEIFANRSYILAPAMVALGGKAVPQDGGYRLNGRWQWASGIMHADWVIPAALELTEDGQPNPRWFALPVSEVTVEDTWYVDGMSGTGSNDVVVEDVFVPAERSVSIIEMGSGHAPGSQLHDGPLYRTPMMPILTLAAAMPALGQARTVVRLFREYLTTRILIETGSKQAERPASQMRLARAEVEVREVEGLLRNTVEDLCIKRNTATLEERARWATQLALAVDQCKRIIQSVCEASGAHSHFLDSPFQRAWRDVNTMSCHVVFDLDSKLQTYGRTLLGIDPGRGASLI